MVRVVWLLGAVCLTQPLWSFWSSPDAPALFKLLVAVLLIVSTLRPIGGLSVLAGLGPMAVPLVVVLGRPSFSGNAALEAMVLAVVAGIALRWSWLGPLPEGRLGPPSLAFAAVAVTSAITQTGSAGAWHEAAIWVEALVLALMIERTVRSSPGSGAVLARVAAFGLAGEAAFSLLRLGQIAARSPDIANALWHHAISTRISPHFPDVNAIGSLFALGTVCWLTVLLASPASRWARTGAIAGSLIMGAGLWLTGSRAAQGATIVTVLCMWRILRRPSLATMAATVAIAGTIVLSFTAANTVQTSRASAATALQIRMDLAAVGLRMAADHPLLGVGPGEFSKRSVEYVSQALIDRFPPAASGENAHNQLIQVLAELGVVGLVVFIWYWVRVLGPAVRCIRTGIRDRWLAAWTAGLCAFLLSALLGHPFLTPYVVYCVFVVVGVVAGLTPENRTSSRLS